MSQGLHPVPHTDATLIDLTNDLDVAYWCRIFDVEASVLRHAVQHSGPRAAEVQRYLNESGGSHPK
jgi:Protein of unknown function (DUF3606)